jgi:hypothetical protein
MKRITKLYFAVFCTCLLSLCNTDVFAQNEALRVRNPEPAAIEQQSISPNDLIKLATKAPDRDRYSSEEEYSEAKKQWVAENPNAYERIVGPTPATKPQPSAGGGISAEEQPQMD